MCVCGGGGGEGVRGEWPEHEAKSNGCPPQKMLEGP